ncbi:Brefeldin A-inhibited guanine nucleotide-exchange protein 1 [Hondaea fermentalgiana]|uniref:Brefeldin A-inhibited guanine nucleotide-exchange protein 1 n=1 Tax=Hondaea fermentalgiana TaxID=2315210 RepID=A0A2R5GEX5_9STRA|nr:Brefeldin A-inhibited guanine nucleotide-exchange protein 1 [Hondaea fermentalgiana]|eukprot:GBG26811.1 Brefeldin A-inhibited guanine nucleotide-exchange protein 1 [Hondaea fermentalgiana]
MRDTLETTLKRILKDAGRKQTALKEAANEALKRLEETSDENLEAGSSPADAYLKPLLLALAAPQPKVAVASLDCLQKLMSYGFLQGQAKARDAGFETEEPDISVMDLVVRAICACEDTEGKGNTTDDSVQLQVIKALLTAVTSAGCGVHETSLLNSVRACYHIHLYSRNPVNKTTAKATLTQMMSAIFQQMEVADARLPSGGSSRARASTASSLAPADQQPSSPPETNDSRPSATSDATATAEAAEDPDDADNDSAHIAATAASSSESGPDIPPVSAESPHVAPPADDFDACMYREVAEQLEMDSLSVGGSIPGGSPVARTGTLKTVSEGANGKSSQKARKQAKGKSAPFKSIQHKDAYLLFRALCKLSMKNQNLVDGTGAAGDNHIPDPIALRSKILSLDLVLSILEASGPAFRNNKDFVYAIKNYLTSSLVKNSVSSNTQVVGLSLRIFVALQSRFAEHLKEEIELVISKIFLPLLESSNSPHEHKVLVLEVFLQIAKDVETLVSIFLNYDCDWDSIDLYSRIVKVLSKLASDPRPTSPNGVLSQDDQQKVALHEMSLTSMVSILHSLAEFTHVQENLPGSSARMGPENPQEESAGAGGDNAGATTTDSEPVAPLPTTGEAGVQEIGEEDESTTQPNVSRHGGSVHAPSRTSVGGDSATLAPSVAAAGAQSLRRLKVDSFQQKQKYRRDIESAASKFLIKPKRGIDFLVKEGYIDRTPDDVASALLEFQDVFSKTKIGEFLGEDAGFNVETLYCYVDQLNFTDQVIDEALRVFLAGFRIPGEAQKIDRIIEKFAARYFENNPKSFPSADTAYVLAFAIIMLHTDLHSPNIPVEKKMTGQAFIAMNGGIAGGRDLDPDFLLGIYERIKTTEISLKEDDGEREREKSKARGGMGGAGSLGFFGNSREALSRRKRAAFSKERQEMVESASLLLPSARAGANGRSRQPGAPSTPTGRQSLLRVRSAGSGMASLHGQGQAAHPTADLVSETSSVSRNESAAAANGLGNGLAVKTDASALGDDAQADAEEEHEQGTARDQDEDEDEEGEDTGEAYFYDENDHVRPMFAVTWAPFCAVFSVNMQNTSEFVTVDAVTSGMKSALRIACRFGMADERRTLFDALTKFTLLSTTQEMKAKHIECVRALVEVVQLEGNYLGSSWEPALKCFSQLSRLQLIHSGATDDLAQAKLESATRRRSSGRLPRRRSMGTAANGGAHGDGSHGGTTSSAGEGSIFSYFQSGPTPEEAARMTDEDNAMRVVKALDMIQIDRIFLDSVNLGSNAIIEMVDALCAVSRMELQVSERATLGRSALDNKPRTFSLQKIVEVADSNMETRPRFVWGRVWSILSDHFTFAGCHKDVRISMYAIDSLRQLTVKFLEKDELTGFSFQLQFMAPFEQMIATSKSSELRDLVLRCSENIILTRSKHIKSGWRVLLNVLSVGGNDPNAEIHSLSFGILDRLVKEHVGALDAHFPELVRCLFSFASNRSNADTELSSKAMDLLEKALKKVLSAPDTTFSETRADDHEHVGRLWALVRSLAMLIGDSRAPVRMRAMGILFSELRAQAGRISPAVWSLLLRYGIFDLFAELRDCLQPFSAACITRIKHARVEYIHRAQAADEELLLALGSFMSPPVTPISPGYLLESGTQPLETTLGRVLSQLTDLLAKMLDGSLADESASALERPDWSSDMRETAMGLLFEDHLGIVERLALTNSGQVSGIGVAIMAKLLSQCGKDLGKPQWGLVVDCIDHIMSDSTPRFLTEKSTRRWLNLEPPENANDEEEDDEENSNEDDEDVDDVVDDHEKDKDEDQSLHANGEVQPVATPGGTNTSDDEAKTSEAKTSEPVKREGARFSFHVPIPGDLLPFSNSTAFTMSTVQLRMLEVMGRVLPGNMSGMSEANLLQVLDLIERSAAFSHEFNDDLSLRQELQRRGFMSDDTTGAPPSLLRQETMALGRYITLLFRADGDAEKIGLSTDTVSGVSSRLEQTLHSLFMHYLFQDRVRTAELEQMDSSSASRDATARRQARGSAVTESEAEVDMRHFTPVVAQSLHEVLHWDVSKMKRQLPWLYPLLTALLDCGNREVHAALRQIFDQQVSKLLGLDVAPSDR